MKIILFICLVFLISCNDYQKLMKPAVEAKLNDKIGNPVFDGEIEPDLPDFDKIVPDDVGVDQNKNGIRDDVDIWINRTGKNYNERMAMRQYARANEEMIKNCNSDQRNNLQEKTDNWIATGRCLQTVTKSDYESTKKPGNSVYDLKKVLYGNWSKRCWNYLNKMAPDFNYINNENPLLNCTFKINK